MSKVNSGLPNTVFNPPDKNADVLEDKDTNVQAFFGYNGLIYTAQKRKELLDQKIEALEVELARLKQLRRGMPQ